MNQPEYLYNPWTGAWERNPAVMPVQAPAATTSNSRTHLLTGLVAGAAITYLLTNRNVSRGSPIRRVKPGEPYGAKWKN